MLLFERVRRRIMRSPGFGRTKENGMGKKGRKEEERKMKKLKGTRAEKKQATQDKRME